MRSLFTQLMIKKTKVLFNNKNMKHNKFEKVESESEKESETYLSQQ